jgi:hypothetical protein
MKIKATQLLEAHQAMCEFVSAILPYAVDSMVTDHDFYKVFQRHADKLAAVGAPLKVYAEMAIKDVELEIEHE